MSGLDIDNACSLSANEPVGTTTLEAAACNLGHLDRIATSTDATSVNRRGRVDPTIAGLNAQAQAVFAAAGGVLLGDGVYGVGIEYTNRNQYLIDSGIPYKVRSTVTLPYTTTTATAIADANLQPFNEVSNSDLTTLLEQTLGAGSSLYIGDDDGISAVVANGDTVPAGTTHLRVSINGNPEIVAISPVSAGGAITLLTETGCGIGGVVTNFSFHREVIVEDYVVGDGVADDTQGLQDAINAGKRLGAPVIAGAIKIRTTNTIYSIDINDGIFAETLLITNGTNIICDHNGVGFMFRGGASFQRQQGQLNFTRPLNRRYSGTYNSANTGVLVSNCRHDIENINVRFFSGEGVSIVQNAGNMNTSTHDFTVNSCGRGFQVDAPANDCSVIESKIRVRSCGREGALVTENSNFRQWVCHWYAENNWLEDQTGPENFGVRINSSTASMLWVYSEQRNGSRDIFARGTGRLISARQNTDDIEGMYGVDTAGTYVGTSSTNEFILGQGGNRIGNIGEYIRFLMDGRLGDGYGYLEGRGSYIGLTSIDETNGVNVENDGIIRIGNVLHFQGEESVTDGSDLVVTIPVSASFTLNNRPALVDVMLTGSTRQGNPLGTGSMTYKASVTVHGDNTVSVLGENKSDISESRPSTITWAYSSGNLIGTVNYASAYGLIYRITYDASQLTQDTSFRKSY